MINCVPIAHIMKSSNKVPNKNPDFFTVLTDWFKEAMPFVTTLILSLWGGVVNHITMLRRYRRSFRPDEFAFDLIISTFAGLLTYFFCKSSNVSETMSAVLIAISGHMGTRALAGFEIFYQRMLGIQNEKDSTNK